MIHVVKTCKLDTADDQKCDGMYINYNGAPLSLLLDSYSEASLRSNFYQPDDQNLTGFGD